VIDPLGQGLRDCLDRRIRFIEDADRRIREDYLRILRYFRFHATYAAPDAGFDPEALDAIARNADGLGQLSAERVGAEMKKLLAAPDPAPALAAMRRTGCLARVLPGSDDRYLGPVVHLAASIGLPRAPALRLAALGGEDPADRLRLSRQDARHLHTLTEAVGCSQPLAEIAYRKGAAIAREVAVLRAAFEERPLDAAVLPSLETAAKAVFPVSAADLMPGLTGKALGDRLAELETRWIGSGFGLSREDLLTGI
jgi:poly(A) polymerase/tRNA nucleotidyltransferase (CCA-adding enzyme)